MRSLFLKVLVCICFHQTLGIVHQFYSSLEITNRIHGCIDELLTLTCNATGRVINWNVGSVHLRFDSTDDVDTIMTREGYITAFLLKIIDSSGGVLKKNFLSIIFINVTEAADRRILPNNIICSSDTHNDTFFGSIADTPQAPQFIKDNMTCFQVTNMSAQCRIHWTEPANKDSFDLDHYQLSVGNDKMNIDAKENEVIISVKMGANITLSITAFDRCGKMSANASNNTIPFNPSDFVETTDKSSESNHSIAGAVSPSKSCGQSGGVNAAFAIMALLVATFFIWSIITTVLLAIKQQKTKGKYDQVDDPEEMAPPCKSRAMPTTPDQQFKKSSETPLSNKHEVSHHSSREDLLSKDETKVNDT